MDDIKKSKGISVADQSIYLDQGCSKLAQPKDSLVSKLKLKHGDILYIKFNTEQATTSVLAKAAPIARKSIGKMAVSFRNRQQQQRQTRCALA